MATPVNVMLQSCQNGITTNAVEMQKNASVKTIGTRITSNNKQQKKEPME